MGSLYYTCLLLTSNINSKKYDQITDIIQKYNGHDWLSFVEPLKNKYTYNYDYKSDNFNISIITFNNGIKNINNKYFTIIYLLYGKLQIVLKNDSVIELDLSNKILCNNINFNSKNSNFIKCNGNIKYIMSSGLSHYIIFKFNKFHS